jgi:hypothetical protein
LLGKVTDAGTGLPIAKASVDVLGTSFSGTTDSTGAYRIDGLAAGSATLRFGAVGYSGDTVIFDFPASGEYRLDRALQPGQGSSLALAVLTTDKPSYGAYSPVSIQIQAQNSGTQTVSGRLTITILDPQGKVVENLQATVVDANGMAQSQLDFAPGTTNLTVPWDTGFNAPASYTVVARVFQAGQNQPGGSPIVELAEKQAGLAIDPVQAIDSVTLTPLPRFTSLGANELVGFRVDIVNRSNTDTSIDVAFQLNTPSGTTVYTGATTVALQPGEGSKSVLLPGLQYKFVESGSHPVSVQTSNGPTPLTVSGAAISVAPGIRIDPSQTISPQIVTPDGDKRIRIEIRLQGDEQK